MWVGQAGDAYTLKQFANGAWSVQPQGNQDLGAIDVGADTEGNLWLISSDYTDDVGNAIWKYDGTTWSEVSGIESPWRIDVDKSG